MSVRFLSYDVKGIQKSIFSVSSLLSIVGGSALIDDFDRNAVRSIAESAGNTEIVFSGGGKGVLETDSYGTAEVVKNALVKEAGQLGLSLRVGISETLDKAMKEGNELFPYVPDNLHGHPCSESGLFPVQESGVHPVIQRRIDYGSRDSLGSRILDLMKELDAIPDKIRGKKLAFVKTIDQSDGPHGKAGKKLFSARNRWAVVSMDGNDLGRQFRECRLEGKARSVWAAKFSTAIAHCTEKAFALAMGNVLEDLLKEDELPIFDDNGQQTILLPFRPLILGGDDVLLLSHTALAMRFVRLMTENFEELSMQANDIFGSDSYPLWPANEDGMLRISSGIVFIGTSYPLHSAIDYAEALLGGAKAKHRSKKKNPEPTPSVIDWESITESFIDNPSDRRFRDLVFRDMDLNGCRIELTRRPYRMDELEKKLIPLKEKLKSSISRSVLTGILENMRKPWSQRVLYLSSFYRHGNNRWIAEFLNETNPADIGDGWIVDDSGIRSTMLLDAFLLCEEEHRISAGGVK